MQGKSVKTEGLNAVSQGTRKGWRCRFR